MVDTRAHGGWTGPMANPTSRTGRRGMRAVSALLGKGLSPWAPTWALVVGAPTARSSVCLGPNDEGILRVMTRTRSDCDELLAREHVVAGWSADRLVRDLDALYRELLVGADG